MHGGQQNIPFTSHERENRKALNVRAENADDTNKLLSFCSKCKKDNPKFYSDIKLDEKGTKILQWLPHCLWVLTYFKKDYYRQMTSTQRSESMNRMVKRKFVDQ
ncbi:hypothetical protein E2562_028787 [Oryza meyeriana var. granulata]|uniref:Uncharacterized protein n=1 Tax=Oryza meyeriana var. granulata TaxID=110450 RepID=A0A6G1ECK9_9ORYZ|nr:hypothetical protein E2562_028787 [Oryza meyeriana var. granulata]